MRKGLSIWMSLTLVGVAIGNGPAQQNDEGKQAELSARVFWRLGEKGTVTASGIVLDQEPGVWREDRFVESSPWTEITYTDGTKGKMSEVKSGARVSVLLTGETSPFLVYPPRWMPLSIVVQR